MEIILEVLQQKYKGYTEEESSTQTEGVKDSALKEVMTEFISKGLIGVSL